jgi:phosphoesterase RecJ-like protein
MKIITDEQINDFKAFLDSHKFFYVIGHKEPDGDCIYSCLGMARLLDKLNLEYQLLNAGPFKRNEVADKAEFFSATPTFLSEPELKKTGLIILDCSEYKRLGELGDDLQGLDTFIIDHHLTASVTENCIIDPSSPATCCLIQQLYEKIAGPLTKEVAEYIFFGQSTDTGYFRFLDDRSSEVFLQTARLIQAGVNPRQTYDKITGGKPYSTRKLLGVLLERSEKYFNDKFIITWETMEDTKKYGLEGRDSDSLYSLLLSCEGVQAVAFLRQDTEHTCTGGLRSRDEVDVSQVAARFGGGGHKNASGFSVEGKLETLIPQVKKEFGKIL